MATQGGAVGHGPGSASAQRLSPRWVALAAAAIILIAGFVALNVMSFTLNYSHQLRGLYTYRSATVGDGLLLPVWAYGLTRAMAVQERWPPWSRLVVACAALAGGAVGVATQIAWLTSTTTVPNWTIPAPHRFNFAGWYHAWFLSVASAVFAALSAALWLRVHSEPTEGVLARLRAPGAFAITGPPLAFAGLLAIDNVPAGQDPLRASTFVLPISAVLALSLLLVTATRRRGIKACVALLAVSVLPVAAFTAIFWPGSVFRSHTLLVVLAAMLGGVVVSPPGRRPRILNRVVVALQVGICLAGPVAIAADKSKVTLVPMATALVVSIALAAAEHFALVRQAYIPAGQEKGGTGVPAVGVVLALTCAGAYLSDGGGEGTWIVVACPILTALIVAPWIFLRFRPVIAAEDDGVAVEELSWIKRNSYQAIGGITGMAIVSLLALIVGTAPTRRWRVGSWNTMLVTMVCVAAGILVIAILIMLIADKRSFHQVRSSAACLASWTAGQCVLFALAQPSSIVGDLVSVFMALVVGLFVAEGIRGNMSSLHNMPIDRPVKVIAALSGLAAGATVLWLLDMTVMVRGKPPNLFAAIAAMIISVAAIQVLPYLAARSLRRLPSRQFVAATPLAGVLQDSFVSLLLGIFVAWLPLAILAHIGDLESWAVTTLAYFCYLAAAYMWIMRNNVEHVTRAFAKARQDAGGGQIPIDQNDALEGLRTHCRRQNALALSALAPVALVASIALATISGGFKSPSGPLDFIKTLLAFEAGNQSRISHG
jgi:hypothetical protein